MIDSIKMYATRWENGHLRAISWVPDPHHVTMAVLRGHALPRRPNLLSWYQQFPTQEIWIISVDSEVSDHELSQMLRQDPSAHQLIQQTGQRFTG